jgi:hypothetical protein
MFRARDQIYVIPRRFIKSVGLPAEQVESGH